MVKLYALVAGVIIPLSIYFIWELIKVGGLQNLVRGTATP
jgi:hypothetical protein